VKHKGKQGTIILEFYKTEEFVRQAMPSRAHTKKYEAQLMEDTNKKYFSDTVRIRAGKVFSLGNGREQFNNGRRDSNQGKELPTSACASDAPFRNSGPRKRD